MKWKGKVPRYAIRLVLLLILLATLFFGGLRLFVPEGSKLTGSYDAASLKYIAAQPVSYQGSNACGAEGCHTLVLKKWSEGAHGARSVQSKCEVCHGPQGEHPSKIAKLPKVRGDGDIAALCLSCHQKLKARGTTGQPQIDPAQHPFPHKGILVCTNCHDPHSPALGATKPDPAADKPAKVSTSKSDGSSLAAKCVGCHGASGRGGFAPVLAGRSIKDLREKMINLKTGATTSAIMNPIAASWSASDMDQLAKYFSRQ